MSLFNPWVIIGIIVALAVSFMAGIKVESDHRDAQLLVQERAHHEAFVKRAADLRGNAAAVSAELAKAKAARRADRQSFKQQLSEATRANMLAQVDCPTPIAGIPAAPPAVRINVGLWDRALTIGRGPGSDPGRTDGAAGGTSFAPLADAYDNLAENSERWKECRDQVRGWQDLARRNGWAK